MSEPVVSYVVNKLGDYLLQEASLFYGVQGQVQWLERELRGILCFLRDADSKRKGSDQRIRSWVRDVRDVAYEAEDIIDSFMLSIDRPSSSTIVDRYASLARTIVPRRNIGKKIEKVRARIREIADRRAAYGIANLHESGWQFSSSAIYESLQARRRLSPHHYDDASVVGLEVDKERIVGQLLGDERRVFVVSIVGIGGIGKTTLAKKVYHSDEVKAEFDVRAWVSVSLDYKVVEILKKIIKQVAGAESSADSDEEELKIELYELLMSRGRFLIVMDDVWRKEVWDRIQTALPDVGNGSRVIFTTRSKTVARFADPHIAPHELQLLDDVESRQLFLKKVFPYRHVEAFRGDLQEVGQKLVEKCHGLPLALVALGGLVSTREENHYQWSRVLNKMNWQLTEEGKACFGILGLSYEDLPCDLKPCFLYIGLFPEDSEISATRLMRRWIAEGFITNRVGEMREVTAEVFLEELIQRCMVQVASQRCDGRVKSIRIHDLLHDLCIEEAREDGFLHVRGSHETDQQMSSSNMAMMRRLALHNVNPLLYINIFGGKWKTPNLRTLLGFDLSGHEQFIAGLNGLKLLRVIEMDVYFAEFPKEISSMIHLRYLSWRSNVSLSNDLTRNLHNLQTLDVLPKIAVASSANIGELKKLQILRKISAGTWIEDGLEKLINLQKLVMYDINDYHWRALLNSLGSLPFLASLTLDADKTIPTEVISIFPGEHPLRSLMLSGLLTKRQLPAKHGFPPNLTKLTLGYSQLEHDPMETLEKLVNLTVLRLKNNAYVGKNMSCTAGGFSSLQHLTLEHLNVIEDWRVEVGAMPKLTHLTIGYCWNLKMLPEGLQYMTALQELRLEGMPDLFCVRIERDVGEDWYKIQHIPSILIID